ncbi:MAG: class I SAM-dependent methyltransferase [Deltaproteobacteria bacterium]|nr:class I SAM-dependent methyltransferase [Deltaproteobacteria bacterium]
MFSCKICSGHIDLIHDFGRMPIANHYLKTAQADEFFYHLQLLLCQKCSMIQLGECVAPSQMFHENYHFISSTSQNMSHHFERTAFDFLQLVQSRRDPFIVEVGCNDGIFLKHVACQGFRHLGVEPSKNVAQASRAKGIQIIEDFFNEKSALKIFNDKGPVDILYGANVITHIEDLASVMKGASALLKKDGWFIFEDPYFPHVMEKGAFDQIYDEHIYYFSVLSVDCVARSFGFKLVDVSPQPVHGGSMRYYLRSSQSSAQPKAVVGKYLQLEQKMGLNALSGYLKFCEKINQNACSLKNMLRKIKEEKNQIVGYGATAKSSTLLNYSKIGVDLLDYITDNTPPKIGKFSPGQHIPIVSHERFVEDHPAYSLLLAWNHKEEIFLKEASYRNNKGKFITYVPQLEIV